MQLTRPCWSTAFLRMTYLSSSHVFYDRFSTTFQFFYFNVRFNYTPRTPTQFIAISFTGCGDPFIQLHVIQLSVVSRTLHILCNDLLHCHTHSFTWLLIHVTDFVVWIISSLCLWPWMTCSCLISTQDVWCWGLSMTEKEEGTSNSTTWWSEVLFIVKTNCIDSRCFNTTISQRLTVV